MYRIINHAPYNSHTNNLFEENKLLKLDDIIKFEQLKLGFLFKNGDLPKELNTLFKLNINTYNTRNASKGGLSIPKINTTSFGIKSLRPRLRFYCSLAMSVIHCSLNNGSLVLILNPVPENSSTFTSIF